MTSLKKWKYILEKNNNIEDTTLLKLEFHHHNQYILHQKLNISLIDLTVKE